MLPRVLIGCPIYDGREDLIDEFIEALNSLSYKNKEILLVDNSESNEMIERIKGKVNVIKSEHTENAREMLARDRNFLREKALKEGFDYFFSLEQDVFPPKDVIEKLLENKKNICGGLYFNYFDSIKGNHESLLEFRPVYYSWASSELKELRILSELSLEEVFPSRLMEVMASGLGCLLIHCPVLEKISFRVQNDKSFDDMNFSEDCFDAGEKIFLDSRIICAHKTRESKKVMEALKK